MERMGNLSFIENIKAGKHNRPLNAFLARATGAVRKAFRGRVTYASLVWEAVDWSLFDFGDRLSLTERLQAFDNVCCLPR